MGIAGYLHGETDGQREVVHPTDYREAGSESEDAGDRHAAHLFIDAFSVYGCRGYAESDARGAESSRGGCTTERTSDGCRCRGVGRFRQESRIGIRRTRQRTHFGDEHAAVCRRPTDSAAGKNDRNCGDERPGHTHALEYVEDNRADRAERAIKGGRFGRNRTGSDATRERRARRAAGSA